VVRLSSIQYES